MHLSLVEILIVVIIFQLLLLSFYLLTNRKGKRESLILLGLFFLALGLNVTDGFLLYQGFYFSYPTVALWGPALSLAFGPLLYLYTRSLVADDFRLRLRHGLHFLPMLLLETVTMGGYWLLTPDDRLVMLQKIIGREMPMAVNIGTALIFLQFVVYITFAWHLTKAYKKIVRNKFSEVQQEMINRLRSLLIFFLFVIILSALSGLVQLVHLTDWYYAIFILIVILLFGFINRTLFLALKNHNLFSGVEENELPGLAFSAPKYGSLALADSESATIHNTLLQHMATHKPHLNPKISLHALAGELKLKPRILSQVINNKAGTTFFDFVNKYRVEEAKKIFEESTDPKLTVLEVMYQTGFNSKSSFNTIFKKETGLTPTEYRSQHSSTSR